MTNPIRIRLETLLRERGLKWSDMYHKVGWHKSFASAVFNGKIIPPLWQRVALVQEFSKSGENVDASVVWDEAVLISSYGSRGVTNK